MQLTPRQVQVLDLLANGKTLNEVAVELGISYKTIEVHCFGFRNRLGVRTTEAALAIGFREGWLR